MPVALQRLWIQLTADRKRFGVLCAVLAVGLLLWARIILTSNVPRTAIADEETAAAAKADQKTPNAKGEKAHERTRERTAVTLDTRVARDPFVISPLYFPREVVEVPPPEIAGKSDGQEADDSEEAAERRMTTLRNLVSRFRLEAVMSGAGIGVISGKTVRLGEFIPAIGNPDFKFELIEVSHRSVMLQFEDDVFELHMSSPGR